MRQETEVPKSRANSKMFANDKHLPGGFRLLAHQKQVDLSPRAPFVPPSVPHRSSGREVTLEDAPRDGSRLLVTLAEKMFAETTNVFPGASDSRRVASIC